MSSLSEGDFRRIATLVETHCGIKMPPAKKVMVEGRLRRRLRALGMADMETYCRHLFDEGGLDREFIHLVNSVTTNKTDFFREPDHFDFLARIIVPELVKAAGAGTTRPFTIWSSACSTGQEPYTIAMVLAGLSAVVPGFDFVIRGTDISSEVLSVATRAIYAADLIEPVPAACRKRHLRKSRDAAQGLVRIAPELRARVGFRRLNLLDEHYPWNEPMDVIFCRNVLIYFDKPTQQAVLSFLCRNLRPGGYLLLGHSETLHGLDLPVAHAAPSVYRRLS